MHRTLGSSFFAKPFPFIVLLSTTCTGTTSTGTGTCTGTNCYSHISFFSHHPQSVAICSITRNAASISSFKPMNRLRKGGRPPPGFGDESSEDDNDDPFAALSSKVSKKYDSNKKLKMTNQATTISASTTTVTNTISTSLNMKMNRLDDGPISSDLVDTTVVVTTETTNANTKVTTKRHHGTISDTRKAKMDALLLELQSVDNVTPSSHTDGRNLHSENNNQPHHQYSSFPPPGFDKRGSFVDPSEEHETTNIFIGNLAPSITEEEMTDLFRQFGDLYSVKIMWPRTAEERIRNRHTGFVCFMNRQDAEDALNTCNETDSFNVGRRLMLRWGKNVKKIVKRGTGGIPIAPIAKRQQRTYQQPSEESVMKLPSQDFEINQSDQGASVKPSDSSKSEDIVSNAMLPKFIVPPLTVDNKYKTIHVQIPSDAHRAKFISTVASFVAKDGHQLERLILAKESMVARDTTSTKNEFDFLLYPIGTSDSNDDTYQRRVNEHQYYKWRVYSFCHGDTYHQWHLEPFVMFQPDGCIWVPPTVIDEEAAKIEELELKRKEEEIAKQRKQRQHHSKLGLYATGRQIEQQQRLKSKGRDGTTKDELSKSDRVLFDKLFIHDLCASRTSICEAMAFCFSKSFAVSQITNLLQDLLLVVDARSCSVDTMIARMFLISDILFNSQQPGVKNAFKFRDWIQKNSTTIFASIGTKYKSSLPGRMTQERLTAAFHTLLAAWANWGVFDPLFLDELDARYQGKEVPDRIEAANDVNNDDSPDLGDNVVDESETIVVYDNPQSEWIEVETNDPDADGDNEDELEASIEEEHKNAATSGDDQVDGSDADGEPVDDIEDDDADGEPMDDEDDPDGEPIDEDDDPDGEPIDDDDVDDDSNPNKDVVAHGDESLQANKALVEDDEPNN